MDSSTTPPHPRAAAARPPAPHAARRTRLPSARAGALLATVMLGIGIAVGAAIGPAPEASLAGGVGVAQKLPALIAARRRARTRAQAPAPRRDHAAADAAGGHARRPRPRQPRRGATARRPRRRPTPDRGRRRRNDSARRRRRPNRRAPPTCPPITSVWLIELSGASFAEALASRAARPVHHRRTAAQGHLPAGLVGAQRQRLRQRRRARRTPRRARRDAAAAALDRPAPVPRRRRRRGLRAGTPGQLTQRRRVPEGRRSRRSPRRRPTHEHGLVVVTFATVADPAAVRTARRRLERDARLPAARRRRAAVALRQGRRALERSPSTRLHPSRASKSSCTDDDRPHPINNERRPRCTHHISPTERPRSGWPRSWACCPAARESGPQPGRRIEPQQLQLPRQHRRRAARSGERRTAGQVHLLLQRPDHRLPGAVADSRDRASSSPPEVTDLTKEPSLRDTFSCSGEVPGWAANCVGAAKAGYENITGQFAIGTKLCAEPRVDPLLTVTYAYLEKGVITQAISGPFDLGRPKGCKTDAYSGFSRFNPKPLGHQEASQEEVQEEAGRQEEAATTQRRSSAAASGACGASRRRRASPRGAAALRLCRVRRPRHAPCTTRSPRSRSARAASSRHSLGTTAPPARQRNGGRRAPRARAQRAPTARAVASPPRSARSARRIYRQAAAGRGVGEAVARVKRSPALAAAISSGDAAASTRGAATALLANQIARIEILEAGRVVRQRRQRPGDRARARHAARSGASFVLSVQADDSYLEGHQAGHRRGVVLLAARGRAPARSPARRNARPAPPPATHTRERNARIQESEATRSFSLAGSVYPAGLAAHRPARPAAAPSLPRLGRADARRDARQGRRTDLPGGGRTAPTCSATLRHIEADAGFQRGRRRARPRRHARGDRRLLRRAHPRRARARQRRPSRRRAALLLRPRRPLRARPRARHAAQRRHASSGTSPSRSRTTPAT